MRIVLLRYLLLFIFVYWSIEKHADEGAIARLQAKSSYIYN
jgi:hypothetical protein